MASRASPKRREHSLADPPTNRRGTTTTTTTSSNGNAIAIDSNNDANLAATYNAIMASLARTSSSSAPTPPNGMARGGLASTYSTVTSTTAATPGGRSSSSTKALSLPPIYGGSGSSPSGATKFVNPFAKDLTKKGKVVAKPQWDDSTAYSRQMDAPIAGNRYNSFAGGGTNGLGINDLTALHTFRPMFITDAAANDAGRKASPSRGGSPRPPTTLSIGASPRGFRQPTMNQSSSSYIAAASFNSYDASNEASRRSNNNDNNGANNNNTNSSWASGSVKAPHPPSGVRATIVGVGTDGGHSDGGTLLPDLQSFRSPIAARNRHNNLGGSQQRTRSRNSTAPTSMTTTSNIINIRTEHGRHNRSVLERIAANAAIVKLVNKLFEGEFEEEERRRGKIEGKEQDNFADIISAFNVGWDKAFRREVNAGRRTQIAAIKAQITEEEGRASRLLTDDEFAARIDIGDLFRQQMRSVLKVSKVHQKLAAQRDKVVSEEAMARKVVINDARERWLGLDSRRKQLMARFRGELEALAAERAKRQKELDERNEFQRQALQDDERSRRSALIVQEAKTFEESIQTELSAFMAAVNNLKSIQQQLVALVPEETVARSGNNNDSVGTNTQQSLEAEEAHAFESLKELQRKEYAAIQQRAAKTAAEALGAVEAAETEARTQGLEVGEMSERSTLADRFLTAAYAQRLVDVVSAEEAARTAITTEERSATVWGDLQKEVAAAMDALEASTAKALGESVNNNGTRKLKASIITDNSEADNATNNAPATVTNPAADTSANAILAAQLEAAADTELQQAMLNNKRQERTEKLRQGRGDIGDDNENSVVAKSPFELLLKEWVGPLIDQYLSIHDLQSKGEVTVAAQSEYNSMKIKFAMALAQYKRANPQKGSGAMGLLSPNRHTHVLSPPTSGGGADKNANSTSHKERTYTQSELDDLYRIDRATRLIQPFMELLVRDKDTNRPNVTLMSSLLTDNLPVDFARIIREDNLLADAAIDGSVSYFDSFLGVPNLNVEHSKAAELMTMALTNPVKRIQFAETILRREHALGTMHLKDDMSLYWQRFLFQVGGSVGLPADITGTDRRTTVLSQVLTRHHSCVVDVSAPLPEKVSEMGDTLLTRLAHLGDLEVFQVLLKTCESQQFGDALVAPRASDGATPLMIAIESNKTTFVEVLLQFPHVRRTIRKQRSARGTAYDIAGSNDECDYTIAKIVMMCGDGEGAPTITATTIPTATPTTIAQSTIEALVKDITDRFASFVPSPRLGLRGGHSVAGGTRGGGGGARTGADMGGDEDGDPIAGEGDGPTAINVTAADDVDYGDDEYQDYGEDDGGFDDFDNFTLGLDYSDDVSFATMTPGVGHLPSGGQSRQSRQASATGTRRRMSSRVSNRAGSRAGGGGGLVMLDAGSSGNATANRNAYTLNAQLASRGSVVAGPKPPLVPRASIAAGGGGGGGITGTNPTGRISRPQTGGGGAGTAAPTIPSIAAIAPTPSVASSDDDLGALESFDDDASLFGESDLTVENSPIDGPLAATRVGIGGGMAVVGGGATKKASPGSKPLVVIDSSSPKKQDLKAGGSRQKGIADADDDEDAKWQLKSDDDLLAIDLEGFGDDDEEEEL